VDFEVLLVWLASQKEQVVLDLVLIAVASQKVVVQVQLVLETLLSYLASQEPVALVASEMVNLKMVLTEFVEL
jgi:hypothetical protein